MATTLDERRQKTSQRPAAAMDLGMVDGAAPLNLTPPKPATPPSIGVNTMNQRAYAESEARKTAANPTGSIYGMAAPAAAAQPPRQPLDAQAASDAKMFGRAWDATKDGFQRAGAAIADVATLPVRAAAGAYDTAVIRPMRAAGLDAGYMSPLVNPASNADGKSMTPFYDQFRARDEMAQTATNYGNEGRRTPMPAASPVANPAGPRGTNEAQAKNPAADQGQVPANDFKKVGDNIYRRGNTFTDQAGTNDTAFLNRGAITPQNQNAAEQLAANYNSNQQALARLQANNATAQPAPAAAPRQFDRAASIRALSDLRSPEAIALRNLRIDAQEEARDSARMGRAGRGNNAAGQAYAALLGELTTGTRQGQTAEMQDGTNRYTADAREAGATQRALMGEEGAIRRAGMTNEVQQGELGLKREAQNITRERDQRLRKAEDDFLNETDPAKREAKARTLQVLMGNGDGTPKGKDRYVTLGGGSRVENGFTVTEPQRVFDTATGREIGAAPAGDITKDPRALAIKNDTKLTREQKAAQLQQLGY